MTYYVIGQMGWCVVGVRSLLGKAWQRAPLDIETFMHARELLG